MNNLLLLGGAGLLIYWWMSQQQSASTSTSTSQSAGAAPPVTTTTAAPGQTTTAPVTSPPVLISPPATTPITTSTPTTPATTTHTPLGVAQIGQNLLSVMANSGDPAITVSGGSVSASGYVFNYYLALPSVNGGATQVSNAPNAVFTSAQLSQSMTYAQYWGAVAQYLTGTMGMSGLGLQYRPRSPFYNASAGGWIA